MPKGSAFLAYEWLKIRSITVELLQKKMRDASRRVKLERQNEIVNILDLKRHFPV